MATNPGTGDPGARDPGAGHPVYGRPTLGELVAAVRESLADSAAGTGPPLSGFRARVAANVLAMVERELARGAGDQQAYAAALARLGVADEAELAAEIRAGRRDRELAELVAEYRHIVAARLAVAHPGYATPFHATEPPDATEPGGATSDGGTARDRTGEDHAAR
jgi:hypothetical protein